MVVLAGHTRLEAARKLGFKTAPVHIAKGLSVSHRAKGQRDQSAIVGSL